MAGLKGSKHKECQYSVSKGNQSESVKERGQSQHENGIDTCRASRKERKSNHDYDDFVMPAWQVHKRKNNEGEKARKKKMVEA